MCEYCDNLDVTGRGKNLSIRKDDLYRDFMQLICFPKTEMRKKKILCNLRKYSKRNNVCKYQFLPDVRVQTCGEEMINRAKLRGEKLDEDCKRANTTTEADLCVCFGLIDNAENLLPKCKTCKALVWNAENLVLKRMKEIKQ